MGKYSDTLMSHFNAPRNTGELPDADLIGHAGSPGHGPYMIIYLRTDGGRVAEARFQTNGCGATIAAGSMLTELVTGRSLQECEAVTVGRLIDRLDGVPANKLHCPAIAVAALRSALARGIVEKSA